MIKLTLKTSGLEYNGKGETVQEAIESLGLTYDRIKAKGVVVLTKGKKTYEHLFIVLQLRRIFSNKQTRLLWSKRLEMLLNSK